MGDFSRAEGSKNHRTSFYKASGKIIDFIGELQNRYDSMWEEVEVLRKERAAIIEETIHLLKNNNIKLGKQLGRCNNKEINEELLNAINALEDNEKETIQINLIKINNRYEKINKLGVELEKLMQTLANYRVLEDDYEEEVIIDFTKAKKELPKNEKQHTNKSGKIVKINEAKKSKAAKTNKEPEENRVIGVHKASARLQESLDQKLDSMRKPETKEESSETIPFENPLLIEEIENASSYANEETQSKEHLQDTMYYNEKDIYNTMELENMDEYSDTVNDSNDYQIEPEYQTNDYLDSINDECILFKISDKLTLKNIAKNVYQSEDNWEPLYNYSKNTDKINRIAEEFGVSIEEVVSNPGYLTNVTLEFPTMLPQEKSSRRIA